MIKEKKQKQLKYLNAIFDEKAEDIKTTNKKDTVEKIKTGSFLFSTFHESNQNAICKYFKILRNLNG